MYYVLFANFDKCLPIGKSLSHSANIMQYLESYLESYLEIVSL